MNTGIPADINTDERKVTPSPYDPCALLLIFTRNPESGKCKTRLAAKVGDKAALGIYLYLLRHTVRITRDLKVTKAVYYSEAIWYNDIWDQVIYRKKLQEGNDLGQRMENAFLGGFASGFTKIIIIGSDMLDLSAGDLANAFELLNRNDVVLGPAEDGGYYLLGLKEFDKRLFQNMSWGGNTVLKNTLDLLADKKVALLETRNDVDVYEDIKDVAVFKRYIKHVLNE